MALRVAPVFVREPEIARKNQRRLDGASARHAWAGKPSGGQLSGASHCRTPSASTSPPNPRSTVRNSAATRRSASSLSAARSRSPVHMTIAQRSTDRRHLVDIIHLPVAPGRAAIVAGYRVFVTGAGGSVAGLAKAQADYRLGERLTHCTRPKLTFVDGPQRYRPVYPPDTRAGLMLAQGSPGHSSIVSARSTGLVAAVAIICGPTGADRRNGSRPRVAGRQLGRPGPGRVGTDSKVRRGGPAGTTGSESRRRNRVC